MILNKTFERNNKGRDFVVGDLHGCYSQLEQELIRVDFNKSKDRLFSVGDLIDRGPENLKCLNLIHEDWFHCVRGNHEQFLVECTLGEGNFQLWYSNGGNWIEHEDMDIVRALAKKVNDEIPLSITVKTNFGNIGICHAEPPTFDWNHFNSDMTNLEIQTALWGRSLIYYPQYTGTKNIDLTIHGHTPVVEHRKIANALFIDTGSFLKEFNVEGYNGVKLLRIDNILEKDLEK